ncbi:hypothetical protein ACIQUQ_19645 [Streptomyces sp. NPDC101118]|uniref:hypothetical protein n=1 Tax=Streptomyces sp. NPDC101118 TaxID=3366109 RepID=UPI0037F8DC3E
MADGFIRWYRESAATSVFAQQVELFAEQGIVLPHPVRGVPFVLDVEGEQVPMEQEELGLLLGHRIADITMTWWFSANTNIIDTFAYEPLGCEIQTLWLDGLTFEEAARVEAAVTVAATKLPVPTRAVIVDRRGISDPEDWDSLVLYDGDRVPRIPDVVLTQSHIAQKLAEASTGLARQEAGAGLWQLAWPRTE